jgi:hypothetical protein
MDDPLRVFVSHTTHDPRDLALAHALHEGLTARGANVWIAPDEIRPGLKWEQELAENLNQATHFLVIISAASIHSEWVQKEIEMARQRYEKNPQLQILPLIIGQLDYFPNQDFLSQFQKLEQHDSQHNARLLEAVNHCLVSREGENARYLAFGPTDDRHCPSRREQVNKRLRTINH